MTHQCDKCHSDYHYTLERCPHCAYPGNYPNVLIASQADERDAVEDRYKLAARAADIIGCRPEFDQFTSWLGRSRPVLARSFADIDRLASSDASVQATFYDLVDAGLVLPSGGQWEQLRRPADEVLFPGYREKIRFGALSGDGIGVISYGHFWMTLRDDFIEHRASVFDQNSVAFVSEKRLRTASSALRGHRACWADRSKVAAAQLKDYVRRSTVSAEFPAILMEQGTTTTTDRFVEVNIWGPITVRTIETVRYRWPLVKVRTPRSLLKGLRRALSVFGTVLEEVP